MDFKKLMKKWWFWVIAVVILSCIIAPFLPDDDVSSGDDSNKASEPPKSSVLMDASIKTADVMNGFGTEKIGTRAYIEVSKDDLAKVTLDEFTEFANSKVKDSGYNWWSIIADDGTGIQFAGSNVSVADYGDLDNKGCITKAIGNITATGANHAYEYESIK